MVSIGRAGKRSMFNIDGTERRVIGQRTERHDHAEDHSENIRHDYAVTHHNCEEPVNCLPRFISSPKELALHDRSFGCLKSINVTDGANSNMCKLIGSVVA